RRIAFKNRNPLPSGENDPDFRGPLGVRDRFEKLTTGATECYVRLPDGGRVWFHATSTTSGGSTTYTFTFKGIIDPYGQTTTITYPSDGSLTVTEPAGRTLKILYTTGPAGDTVLNYLT